MLNQVGPTPETSPPWSDIKWLPELDLNAPDTEPMEGEKVLSCTMCQESTFDKAVDNANCTHVSNCSESQRSRAIVLPWLICQFHRSLRPVSARSNPSAGSPTAVCS